MHARRVFIVKMLIYVCSYYFAFDHLPGDRSANKFDERVSTEVCKKKRVYKDAHNTFDKYRFTIIRRILKPSIRVFLLPIIPQ